MASFGSRYTSVFTMSDNSVFSGNALLDFTPSFLPFFLHSLSLLRLFTQSSWMRGSALERWWLTWGRKQLSSEPKATWPLGWFTASKPLMVSVCIYVFVYSQIVVPCIEIININTSVSVMLKFERLTLCPTLLCEWWSCSLSYIFTYRYSLKYCFIVPLIVVPIVLIHSVPDCILSLSFCPCPCLSAPLQHLCEAHRRSTRGKLWEPSRGWDWAILRSVFSFTPTFPSELFVTAQTPFSV